MAVYTLRDEITSTVLPVLGRGLGMRCIDRPTPDQAPLKTTFRCGRYGRRGEEGWAVLHGHVVWQELAGGGEGGPRGPLDDDARWT